MLVTKKTLRVTSPRVFAVGKEKMYNLITSSRQNLLNVRRNVVVITHYVNNYAHMDISQQNTYMQALKTQDAVQIMVYNELAEEDKESREYIISTLFFWSKITLIIYSNHY